jgi:hypothetical protein
VAEATETVSKGPPIWASLFPLSKHARPMM